MKICSVDSKLISIDIRIRLWYRYLIRSQNIASIIGVRGCFDFLTNHPRHTGVLLGHRGGPLGHGCFVLAEGSVCACKPGPETTDTACLPHGPRQEAYEWAAVSAATHCLCISLVTVAPSQKSWTECSANEKVVVCGTGLIYACVCLRAARLGCGSAAARSAPERRVHRLLSFQRYLHSSRLLRGIPQQIPLHILDEDYTGQARVRKHTHVHTHTQLLHDNKERAAFALSYTFI